MRWVQEQVGDAQLSRIAVRTRTGIDPEPVEFNKVRPGEQIFRVGGGQCRVAVGWGWGRQRHWDQ